MPVWLLVISIAGSHRYCFPLEVSSRKCSLLYLNFKQHAKLCFYIRGSRFINISLLLWLPSKHAGSDPEAFWLRLLQPACSQNRAGLHTPGPTSRIRFNLVPFFSKKARIVLCTTDLDPIWMAWPGFWAKRILSGSKSLCKNHRARFWQNATGPLPVPHFQTRLCSSLHGPDHNHCAKPARIRSGSG